ncbi:hypothetical protein I4U23_013334 [Adineta vaga]|nr:hypothetical protein I4U23_013334 [Adineta vaga]
MVNPMEQYYNLLVNPLIIVRFYQIGYTFTFLLGFLGNTASLLTFSRTTLRKVSTGCLFMVLAIFDTLYLLMCVFDYLEFGFKVPFYPHIAYSEFCRFRYFVMNVAQMASAWTLVIVSIDRWIRTQFPFKSAMICTPRNALIAVGVLLVFDMSLHAHMLTSMFEIQIPGFANAACGPNYFTNKPYFSFFFTEWSIIQIFTTCLGPVSFMLIALIATMINICLSKRTVIQPVHLPQEIRNTNRQKHVQKQILPIGIAKIIASQISDVMAAILDTSSAWTILGWIQSLNFAINFYIHCLSSTLFRKEFKQQMKIIIHRNEMPVTTIEYFSVRKREQVGYQHSFIESSLYLLIYSRPTL